MLTTASFAPPLSPVLLKDRIESRLRPWVTAPRAELIRAVSRTEVIRDVLNQDIHLYAVSTSLLEEAAPAGGTGPSPRACMRLTSYADRRDKPGAPALSAVTTAMSPWGEYVATAGNWRVAVTDVTHDGLHERGEITDNLFVGQALTDLRYTACDVHDFLTRCSGLGCCSRRPAH
jgi:hypothetical protein